VISTALVPGDTGGKIVDAIKEAIAAGANTVITRRAGTLAERRDARGDALRLRTRLPGSPKSAVRYRPRRRNIRRRLR